MYSIKFTRRGEKDFKKLASKIRRRINKKLIYYTSLKSPLIPARPLVHLPPATHRYRIGKYRLSFFIKGKTIYIERIEIRNKAYRQK